jgi:CheY-like chemotaxis protein
MDTTRSQQTGESTRVWSLHGETWRYPGRSPCGSNFSAISSGPEIAATTDYLENRMFPVGAARLLIADDDAELLVAYTLFFRDRGFEIRTALNGADALAEYWAWHPAAVILDIEMPRLDGRAVAREIRYVRAMPAPLLVAVTGLGGPSEWAESTRSGFDHHFVKPVLLPIVLAAITLGLAAC